MKQVQLHPIDPFQIIMKIIMMEKLSSQATLQTIMTEQVPVSIRFAGLIQEQHWQNGQRPATTGTNAGRWHRCLGEGSACEVKVVRILSDNNKTTSVRQVTSKCANESSCIANMKQNFNPKIASAGNWYKQYLMQQCKPFGVGDRFKSNGERSSCVFCVEPCTETEQSSGVATGGCVGPSADGVSKGTVNAASIDVFDPATLASNGAGNQYTTGNYYSTVTGTYTKNSVSVSLEVSTIQAAQLGNDFV